MAMKNLIVSPSPHIHGPKSTRSLMTDVIIALAPAMLVSVWYFGVSAITLLVTGVVSCVAIEYLIQRFLMKKEPSVKDCSAIVTGILLALNMPPAAPWWLVVIGSVVAIGIAKMTFGGIGQNLFNPALVGRVFLLVSFPVLMTNYAQVDPLFPGAFSGHAVDAVSGATPLAIVKEGLGKGMTLSQIFAENDFSSAQMFFVRIGGSAGEVSAIALLIGFAYLLARKVIKPHIPLAIFATVFVFSGILWLADPERYADPLFNLLTGGILLGAIFMATDYVTSPMSTKGMVIYGIGIGMLTILIRDFGSYPEGVSFAILIMNAVVPLLNMYCKPKRFGKEVKNG